MATMPLVSVVIPAYNAEKTIDECLLSARTQSYRNLEIIVVDDGSVDSTPRKVELHAEADRRVRLVRQDNQGVAAARNRGIQESRSDFIAPLDADDLWRSTKIEKQVSAVLGGGTQLGLVYTWQAAIDAAGLITTTWPRPEAQGWVLEQMLLRNVVGGGSAALMRKRAVEEAGGYDSSLRARGGQGCEDLKLYRKIAERYQFAVIREFLTGYRRTPCNMSSNISQMLRSYDLVASEARRDYPDRIRQIEEGAARYRRWLMFKALRQGDARSALFVALTLLSRHPWLGLKLLGRTPLDFIKFSAATLQRKCSREREGPEFFLPRSGFGLSEPRMSQCSSTRPVPR